MSNILIVGLDGAATGTLAAALEAEAFKVTTVDRLDLVETQVASLRPEIIVLDELPPDAPGLDLSRTLRQGQYAADTPIIVISRRHEEDSIVRWLDAGVDDHLTKPIAMRELLARMRSALRRRNAFRTETDHLEIGSVTLNRRTRRVTRRSVAIHLAPTEFEILQFMMERPGRIVSRDQLRAAIWGHMSELSERAIDVNIGRLRRALSKGGEGDTIRTVRGEGYYFDDR